MGGQPPTESPSTRSLMKRSAVTSRHRKAPRARSSVTSSTSAARRGTIEGAGTCRAVLEKTDRGAYAVLQGDDPSDSFAGHRGEQFAQSTASSRSARAALVAADARTSSDRSMFAAARWVALCEPVEREPVGGTSPSGFGFGEQPGRLTGGEIVDVVEADVAGLEQSDADGWP